MIDLTGKLALVTGAARGIGKATAIRLAEAGADIVLNYVAAEAAAEETAGTIASLGRRVAMIKADISEPDDILQMVEHVRAEFGQLDILVSNAATGGFRPLLATTTANFEAAMNTNVRALIQLVQAALPLLESCRDRAKVVSLSSHGSHRALPMYGLIGASKAALESIVRHVALELGDRGINFNIVQAGLVETDSTRRLPGSAEMFRDQLQHTMVGERFLTTTDCFPEQLWHWG